MVGHITSYRLEEVNCTDSQKGKLNVEENQTKTQHQTKTNQELPAKRKFANAKPGVFFAVCLRATKVAGGALQSAK